MKVKKYTHVRNAHVRNIKVYEPITITLIITAVLCCGILNATDGSKDHLIRESIPRITARDDGGDEDNPLEGLYGDDEDANFVNQKMLLTRRIIQLLTTQQTLSPSHIIATSISKVFHSVGRSELEVMTAGIRNSPPTTVSAGSSDL